jgi:hypothetical protein
LLHLVRRPPDAEQAMLEMNGYNISNKRLKVRGPSAPIIIIIIIIIIVVEPQPRLEMYQQRASVRLANDASNITESGSNALILIQNDSRSGQLTTGQRGAALERGDQELQALRGQPPRGKYASFAPHFGFTTIDAAPSQTGMPEPSPLRLPEPLPRLLPKARLPCVVPSPTFRPESYAQAGRIHSRTLPPPRRPTPRATCWRCSASTGMCSRSASSMTRPRASRATWPLCTSSSGTRPIQVRLRCNLTAHALGSRLNLIIRALGL